MSDQIFNSEYDNVVALYGLDAIEGAMIGATPTRQAKLINKVMGKEKNSKGSRAQMENAFPFLQKHIFELVRRGELRLTDYMIYSIKPVTSRTIKMFESQDDKEIGLRNISNQKLPKNTALLVSGIIMLVGNMPEVGGEEAKKAIDFISIREFPAIANGEFSLKANKRQIIAENQSNRCFVTDQNQTSQLGYYRLDNPRLINDEEVIEFTVELGTMLGINAASTHLYVALVGTATTP